MAYSVTSAGVPPAGFGQRSDPLGNQAVIGGTGAVHADAVGLPIMRMSASFPSKADQSSASAIGFQMSSTSSMSIVHGTARAKYG